MLKNYFHFILASCRHFTHVDVYAFELNNNFHFQNNNNNNLHKNHYHDNKNK